jgi:hypothetical protein
MCTDNRDFAWMNEPASAEELAWPDPEALVTGLDGFAAAVQSLHAAHGDRCATMSLISSRSSLALDLADGTRVLCPRCPATT